MLSNDAENRIHWDNVYATKKPNEVSWTQEMPHTSLALIKATGIDKSAPIIDVGGGDSKLVDCLMAEGYENITVLDISGKALEKARNRLGANAEHVSWIQADITTFKPTIKYALWHDRATFHFLTTPVQIAKYVNIARCCVLEHLIIGTFSQNGPQKCSGLEIKQYNKPELTEVFHDFFSSVSCLTEDHRTPFGTLQNFIFCSFKAKK